MLLDNVNVAEVLSEHAVALVDEIAEMESDDW